MSTVLDGYAHVEPPRLPAHRFPPDELYHSSPIDLVLPVDVTDDVSILQNIVTVAVGRTLSVYCASSDIVVGIQADEGRVDGVVRLTWDDETTWCDLRDCVATSLQAGLPSSSFATKTLGLQDAQVPSVAKCHFSLADEPASEIHPHPITFYYQPRLHTLRLNVSQTYLHPTVADQMLLQTSRIAQFIAGHPNNLVSRLPSLDSNLMSVFERLPEESIQTAYPHTAALKFAPDYLKLRSEDASDSVAIQWCEDLSLQRVEQPIESISYLELHEKANRVARWLRARGLKSEDRVALCLERNLDFHACLFGVMRAGGCYVPIDPELPIERKRYIVQDSEARIVFTSKDLIFDTSDLPDVRVFDILNQNVQEEISQEAAGDLSLMDEDGLAYLLYTSGTTGNPKGCLLTHRGLAQAILALSSEAIKVRLSNLRDGKYLAVASIAFDVHLGETFIPFVLGIPLFSARRAQLFENLPAYVNHLRISHLGIVPSLIEATLNAAHNTDGNSFALRFIASGGEKMSDSILDKWADHEYVKLANFYGPSEVTIGCAARIMSTTTPRANIGHAFWNVSAYVVDADLNILPRGGMGELVVEGPLVGRGYQGRPDLTAKVFMKWPTPQSWAYRTGDLVRMMPDSTIEIMGRIDTQIKLRGVRIESEGISAIVRGASSDFTGVTLDSVTILARHDKIGADQLISFFVWDHTIGIGTRKSRKPYPVQPPEGLVRIIRAHCEAKLPSYMRPSHLVPLSWLPLSSNGKVDTKVLTQIFLSLSLDALSTLSGHHDPQKSAVPCSDEEHAVFDIIRQHATTPFTQPFPGLDIFQCGMDSMAVIRFTSALRARFGRSISASEVLKAQTLARIASALALSPPMAPGHHTTPDVLPQDLAKEVSGVYGSTVECLFPPLSIQPGVIARSAHDDHLYVQHVVLRCRESTSIDRVRASWNSLISTSPILRTVFYIGRDLVQVVLKHENAPDNWSVQATEVSDSDAFVERFLDQYARPLSRDINRNVHHIPPHRMSVYQSPTSAFIVLSIHHALYDGISLARLLIDLEDTYQERPTPDASALDHIFHQLAQVDYEGARKFWKETLLKAQWPRFSLTNDSSVVPRRYKVNFKESLSSLQKLASFQGATVQALLTATYAYFVAKDLYFTTDVAFGVLRSGRLIPVANIDTALLPLLSLVPFRVNFSLEGNLLKTIQCLISGMVEYEHVPLSKVQGWERGGDPLFETLFSCSTTTAHDSALWTVIESEPPRPDFPLAIEVVQDPSQNSLFVQGMWTDPSLDAKAKSWLTGFEHMAQTLATSAAAVITELRSCSTAYPTIVPRRHTLVQSQPRMEEFSPLQKALLQVVAEFMQTPVDSMHLTTSLFSLGLDSIKSVGLSRSLARQGFEVSSLDILRNATIEGLANVLQEAGRADEDLGEDGSFRALCAQLAEQLELSELRLSPDDQVEVFPASALQSGMLSQTIGSEGRLYNHVFSLALEPNLKAEAVEATWRTVANVLAILRTTFHFLPGPGRWVQVVHSDCRLQWSCADVPVSAVYPDMLLEFLHEKELASVDAFSIAPFRLRLYTFPDGTAKLGLVMHHALYDGLSIDKLFKLADAIHQGKHHHEPKQYHALLPHIVSQEEGGTTFWVERLKTFQIKRLKVVRMSSSPSEPPHILERSIALDPSVFQNFVETQGVGAQCIGQAALAIVLSRTTNCGDVTFGHTVSGRTLPGAEEVIGPVLNTIPCCVRMDDRSTHLQIVRELHQWNLDALSWQHSSIRTIQKRLGKSGLWDALFLFQPAVGDDDTTLWSMDTPLQPSEVSVQYPVNVEVHQTPRGFSLKCAIRSDYFSREDAIAFVDFLLTTFLNIVDHPDKIVLTHKEHTLKRSPSSESADSAVTVPGSVLPLPARKLPSKHLSIITSTANASPSSISPETPISALGIDSITAIQMIAKFKDVGLKLSVKDILDEETVGGMLSRLVEIRPETQSTPRPPVDISPRERSDLLLMYGHKPSRVDSILPSTSGISWLVGAWQKSRGTRFQHVFPFRIVDGIQHERLRFAWKDLVDRHPILRSTVVTSKEGFTRIVTFAKEDACNWQEEHVDSRTYFNSLLGRMKELVSYPPTSDMPPTRAILYRSNAHAYLLIYMNHFQYDAWSFQLLLHDLSCLYHHTPSDVSGDLRAFVKASQPTPQAREVQRRYWYRLLSSEYKPNYFPSLRKAVDSVPPSRLLCIEKACVRDAARCETQARSLGITLQSVFLAAWAKIQSEYSKSESSTFGLWTSGRTGTSTLDMAKLALPCMNVVPVHVSGLANGSIIDVARRIQADLRGRPADIEQTDHEDLMKWVGSKGKPLYNVFVNIVKTAVPVEMDTWVLEPVRAPHFIPDEIEGRHRLLDADYLNSTSRLIQDDVFIDIATLESNDTILMSLDVAPYIMDENQGAIIMSKWAYEVQQALGIL